MKFFFGGYPTLFLLALIFFVPVDSSAYQSAEQDTLQQKVKEGQNLFVGKTRFTNGGPACISCHSLDDPTLPISGGNYAVNITGFTNLPHDALSNRILEISFPRMAEMKAAYVNNPVTEQEANKIIAYLKNLPTSSTTQSEPMLAGLNFLWAGLIAFIIILAVIWVSWYNRKKGSVNKEIYQRQIQSV